MTLFVSTAWSEYNERNIKDKIEEFILKGIINIELSGGADFYEGIESDILDLNDKYNLNFILHNYFPPQKEDFVLNIASEDENNLKKSIDFVKKNINLASKFKSRLYTFHAGYAKKLNVTSKGYFKPDPGKIDWQKTYNTFYKSLDEILYFATKKGVRIGIENLFPFNEQENYSIMCTIREIEEMLFRYKDNKYLGLLIDFGHLNVAAHYMGFDRDKALDYLIAEYRDRIFEIHISDNGGSKDEHLPISENGWQIKLIERYELFDKPIVIEGMDLSFNLINKISKRV
ncbi:hypothetical protein U472_03470 [Orenia metallireducens]|uniref:Xylose isomerase-like TIM barrel domain-containing protein n=1 Tax=Orenia metallireducens TaxID=1413210 RepID=A0A1C0AB63_9FIRM|nr:sugar phosphate isomerase/epimerase family protein [Orenia metallireducens]OCL27623.1 hypothetical protein U472_03470 [Orenia metallireducens]